MQVDYFTTQGNFSIVKYDILFAHFGYALFRLT